MASFGAAVCHGPSPFHVSGTCAAGRLYPGPTVQPSVLTNVQAASKTAASKAIVLTGGNRITSAQLLHSARLRAPAALPRGVGRVDDDPIAQLEPAKNFEGRAEVAADADRAQMYFAVLVDDRDSRPLSAEEHGIHWNRNSWNGSASRKMHFAE